MFTCNMHRHISNAQNVHIANMTMGQIAERMAKTINSTVSEARPVISHCFLLNTYDFQSLI